MSLHEAGWVLMFPDKTMFGITHHHENLVRLSGLGSYLIVAREKESIEWYKEEYPKFLADAKPMKLSYMLSEDY